MSIMPQTGKPLFNNPTLQDTFENLSDQGSDVVQGLQDLVTPKSDQAGGDTGPSTDEAGIEQLGGPAANSQTHMQAGKQQGLNPQQLAEKRAEEKKKIEFFQTQVKGWEEHQLQVKQEEEQKKQQAEEEERKQKEQEIIELRQEEARSATLNPAKAKGPGGPGSAFIPYQAKSSMGTGELSKTPTN